MLVTLLALTLPAVANESSRFTFKPGGQIMYDIGWHKLDDETSQESEGYRREDGFRRARLSARGRVANDWQYNLTLNIANALNNADDGDSVEIWQAFVSYRGWQDIRIKGGQYVEPFGLENSMSSLDTTFMERGLPYALSPVISAGLSMAASPAKSLYGEVGVFTQDVTTKTNLRRAVTGRLAFAPVDTDSRLAHVGLSLSHRLPKEDAVRYRTGPEADFAPTMFSSGNISDVDSVFLTGIEAAFTRGPASLQAERIRGEVHRLDKPTRRLDSYYVYASFLLTGESRPYQDGRFKGITPKNRWGAWDLALRYSEIDNDEDRRLKDITLGLNAYLSRHLRFMINYVRAEADKDDEQSQADIYQVRLQASY